MNTKILLTASSLVLGLAGLSALFVHPQLLAALGLPLTKPLPVLMQLIGALYFSLAFMNWTAKDSVIGGIYARPISLANFGHFLIGTLVLARDQLSNGANIAGLVALGVYAVFAVLFWWLVFRHTGTVKGQSTAGQSPA